MFGRNSGLLLHPTSLPGRFGIGDLGPEAFRFADFLAGAGQRLWQVLPIGHTGYGDSPYQCFSAFAGNPLLISPELLHEEGLLSSADLSDAPAFPTSRVDYGAVMDWKYPLLRKAYSAFRKHDKERHREEFQAFRARHAGWLPDYAKFLALKNAQDGAVWTRWRTDDRARPETEGTEAIQFWQFLFFRQWDRLKHYCHERGIRIVGDLPIYVAHDSADVWSHRDLFCLKPDGEPEKVAGVPPDYFSATGQLWGNPIYRWDVMAGAGYQWWVDRFRATFSLFDIVRVDHFRGFEAYWEIPAGEDTAINGRWVKGPGPALFEAVENALGKLPIVAENLGVITPEVEAIRHRFGFPGMAVLQFAFGNDPQAPTFRPHNYPRNLVAYTGTHDNDTTVGWWTSGGESDSTRGPDDIRKERAFATSYLDLRLGDEIQWMFIRALMASVADTVLVPLQDVLGLSSEARMNLPASRSGNWRWRYRHDALTGGLGDRLRRLSELYDRC